MRSPWFTGVRQLLSERRWMRRVCTDLPMGKPFILGKAYPWAQSTELQKDMLKQILVILDPGTTILLSYGTDKVPSVCLPMKWNSCRTDFIELKNVSNWLIILNVFCIFNLWGWKCRQRLEVLDPLELELQLPEGPGVDAGTPTQILWKSSTRSESPSCHSSF